MPLITSVLALIPFVILLITYGRTRSPRILLASSAFAVFVLKGILLSAGFFIGSIEFEIFEFVEFGSDFIIVLLFATSFLWSFREPS